MRAFTVEARSLESAQALYDALSAFRPGLSGDDRAGYRVSVALPNGDRDVVAVLNAVQQFVTERNDGPAQVDLEGRGYTLHPDAD